MPNIHFNAHYCYKCNALYYFIVAKILNEITKNQVLAYSIIANIQHRSFQTIAVLFFFFFFFSFRNNQLLFLLDHRLLSKNLKEFLLQKIIMK
jgi:hypothetical protein